MRAKKFILLLIILLSSTIVFSQVGIGIAPPNASAMLDVDVSSLPTSGKKGFLPPRMDEAARDLIGTPATGLLIYNTNTNQLNYYNGSAWQIVDTSTGFVNLTTEQTNIAGNKTFTGTLIPEGRLMLPMGELSYFNTTGHTVLLETQNTFVKINPVSGVNFLNDGFSTGANGDFAVTDSKLTYNGATTRLFHIALSFSFSPGSNNDIYVLGVAKGTTNATVADKSKVIVTGSSGDNSSSAMHVALWLAQGEKIEFHVAKTNGTGSINIKSFNFFAMGM